MSYTYGGVATNFPALLTLPSDGDARTAASVDVALEGLADRTKWLQANVSILGGDVATSDDTFNAPTNANAALVFLVGGGGGGGGGRAVSLADVHSAGGGGGGGAVGSWQFTLVTGGASYDAVIGLGGTGGGSAADGSDGGDTLFKVTAGATLLTGKGAEGGQQGETCPTLGINANTWGFGGQPVANGVTKPDAPEVTSMPYLFYERIPQHGGHGVTGSTAMTDWKQAGQSSPQGYAGGVAGTQDTTSSGTYRGGGCGGGGGAGPLGVGGAGGNGGTPNNAGAGGNGTQGTSAGNNTGAGGGGGGSAGAGTSAGTGGSGGNGGSGYMRILWLKVG